MFLSHASGAWGLPRIIHGALPEPQIACDLVHFRVLPRIDRSQGGMLPVFEVRAGQPELVDRRLGDHAIGEGVVAPLRVRVGEGIAERLWIQGCLDPLRIPGGIPSLKVWTPFAYADPGIV